MEIAAVGRDDFVQGFKLVGVRRAITSSREEIEKKIAAVLDDPEVGILGLDTADMKGLSNSMRRRLETVAGPVVIAGGAAEGGDRRTKGERAIGGDLFKGGGRVGGEREADAGSHGRFHPPRRSSSGVESR